MIDVLEKLEQIERKYDVEFESNVRTAVEARTWLVKLGVAFTVDGLLRAVLRNGFGRGSIFEALKLRLSKPRRDRTAAASPVYGAPGEAEISDEVFECLDLAARIKRGLSFATQKPCVNRDSVVIAIAQRFPEIPSRNLVPRDLAERSMTSVRAIAQRALSEQVSLSEHYLLRKEEEIRDYFNARDWFRGWRLERLVVIPSSVDRHLFAHLSVRENPQPADGAILPSAWETPGRHDDLFFYAVSEVRGAMTAGEFRHDVEIAAVVHRIEDSGLKHFTLDVEPEGAGRAGLGARIELAYLKELTAAEHIVAVSAGTTPTSASARPDLIASS